ncbi:MAG TPA: AAA family ATPase, partial [Kiloniellales bacterium]|nr:AAA family ATPase [Kiloniellales bacterium]
EVWHRPIDALSKGFKRRVGLAQALIHDPPVLILDEPTDGLDPNQKHEVRSLLELIAPDKAIVISTHILEEVEAVCTRAIIVARGRIIADAQPSVLFATARPDEVFRRLTLPETADA